MDTNQPTQQPTPSQATPAPAAPPPRPPEQVITELRARVNAGQALTRDQVREALAALRQNRMTAADSASGKKKSAAPTRSATELLAGLKSGLVGNQGG